MSAYHIYPSIQVAAAAGFCFVLASLPSSLAGTQKDFFQGFDLNVANNYNPAGLPATNFDVLLTTPLTALSLDAAVLQMGSLNLTANNVAYMISNNTSTSTASSISLSPSFGGGNSISGQTDDGIFVGGTNSSLTIQGMNGETGSGGLSLGSNSGFSVDIAQASSALNISAPISFGTGGGITKTGAGVLNLSGSITAGLSGSLRFNQGTSNLLPGFAGAPSIGLSVNNTGPSSDVTLNIQTSVWFRSLSGSVADSSSHATINLAGTGTQLQLGVNAGGTFAGSITGTGSVLLSSSPVTQTFSGNNTYAGTTTIRGGILRIDGVTSGQGNYALIGDGFIAGSGTIGLAMNNTLSATAGRLTAGGLNELGTLNVLTSGTGGVIIRDQGIFLVDIGAAGASDVLAIGGGYFDISSASDSLILNGLAGAFDGSAYTIATFDQNLNSGTFNSVAGLPSNYVVSYSPTAVRLQPVPEPSVFALGGQVLLLACGLSRRFRGARS